MCNIYQIPQQNPKSHDPQDLKGNNKMKDRNLMKIIYDQSSIILSISSEAFLLFMQLFSGGASLETSVIFVVKLIHLCSLKPPQLMNCGSFLLTTSY